MYTQDSALKEEPNGSSEQVKEEYGPPMGRPEKVKGRRIAVCLRFFLCLRLCHASPVDVPVSCDECMPFT
jgi:hypothetical protein